MEMSEYLPNLVDSFAKGIKNNTISVNKEMNKAIKLSLVGEFDSKYSDLELPESIKVVSQKEDKVTLSWEVINKSSLGTLQDRLGMDKAVIMLSSVMENPDDIHSKNIALAIGRDDVLREIKGKEVDAENDKDFTI